MTTQILLEEKRALLNETKELIVDESKIFGGTDFATEITFEVKIEFIKGSKFLG